MAYIDKFGVEYSDDKKKLVRCPKDFEGEYIIPNGTEIIESESFAECTKLTSITIPDSVTDIMPYTFSGCSLLNSLTLGAGIENIYMGAFFECDNLLEIHYNGSVKQWCSIEWNRSIGSGLSNYELYIQGSIVEDLVIPNGIQEIKPFAFSECSSIASIVIPDSVIKIDKSAFENCWKLSKVSLGKNLTCIGESAFAECIWLEEIAIPQKVEAIGEDAFCECAGLNSVIFENYDTAIQVGKDAFEGCAISIPLFLKYKKSYEKTTIERLADHIRIYPGLLWLKDFHSEDIDAAIEQVCLDPDSVLRRDDGSVAVIAKKKIINQVIKMDIDIQLGIDDLRKKVTEVHHLFETNQDGSNGFVTNSKEASLASKVEKNILLIRGINKETVNKLPQNFTYNLIKSRTLMGYQISSNWLIIIESTADIDTGNRIAPLTPSTFK